MDEMTIIDKIQQDTLTKNKILHLINGEEYTGASEVYDKVCKVSNGLPPISWAEEVAAYVQNYIPDDAEINIYFPNLPISEGKDGAYSTENNQQFSHEDVGASEARFNAAYDRGTVEQKGGDDSGDKKDGGAEGGKRDDTAERNHGEDDNSWEESSDQDLNLPISEGKDGAHSTENNQQFSHKDVGTSEARFNAEYERGTAGEEGDHSGD
jgi:hypothetical protein